MQEGKGGEGREAREKVLYRKLPFWRVGGILVGNSTEANRVQEAFEKYSWVHGVILEEDVVQDQKLDSVIFVGPFPLKTLCDSVIQLPVEMRAGNQTSKQVNTAEKCPLNSHELSTALRGIAGQ